MPMPNHKTRTTSYFGEVLDASKSKRLNGLCLNLTASPYEKRLYYSKVFMDPTNTGIMRTRRSTLGNLLKNFKHVTLDFFLTLCTLFASMVPRSQ